MVWDVAKDFTRFLSGPNRFAGQSGLWASMRGDGERSGLERLVSLAAELLRPYVIRPGTGRVLRLVGTEADVFVCGEDEILTLAALALACEGGTASPNHERFEALARQRSLDITTLAMARAATALDIPVYRHPGGGFIQLGQGRKRRLAMKSLVEPASYIAVGAALNRLACQSVLRRLGLPVLRSAPAPNSTEAVRVATDFGMPVAVKSLNSMGGVGSALNLTRSEEVAAAFQRVAVSGGGALVEAMGAGADHFLLTAGDRVIAAVTPGGGRTPGDVSEIIHPDNAEAARRAVTGLGLSVAEVSFLSADIGRSWREGNGWILGVNSRPSLEPYQAVAKADVLADAIVRQAFPAGENGRIPTVGITGSVGKTTTSQMVRAIAEAAGLTVGATTTQGIWSGRFRVAVGDMAGGQAAERLLGDPSLDAAVLEMARGGLLKQGMYLDGFDVAAVLNVLDSHVGRDGIESREALAEIKSILVRQARRHVVLNADDPLALSMRGLAGEARLALVARDGANPDLAAHAAAGGCTTRLQDAAIRLSDGGVSVLSLPLDRIPAAQGGASRAITDNALFAVTIAHCLGLGAEAIEAGLCAFSSDPQRNPGRHNRIDGFPFELMLHWVSGLYAFDELLETLAQSPTKGVRRLCFASPSDRGDDLIVALGRAAAGHFDRFHCANIMDLRGRDARDVPALLAKGLREGGVADAAIVEYGAEAPYLSVLAEACPGDRVVILAYDPSEALAAVEAFRQGLG